MWKSCAGVNFTGRQPLHSGDDAWKGRLVFSARKICMEEAALVEEGRGWHGGKQTTCLAAGEDQAANWSGPRAQG